MKTTIIHDDSGVLPDAQIFYHQMETFDLSILLEASDPRLPAIRELLNRVRDALEGRVTLDDVRGSQPLAPWDPTTVRDTGDGGLPEWNPIIPRIAGVGRPAKLRYGRIMRKNDIVAFFSMGECASILSMSYGSVSTRYSAECRKLGLDPDDHPGFIVKVPSRRCRIEFRTRTPNS